MNRRKNIQKKKRELIKKLINMGVYKRSNRWELYKLTLPELSKEYRRVFTL
ncbi:Fur-regulated basic protein FbpA [Pseudalkalibacillus sp. A8]|uniref:Fur-regulated basic protein FbpA n=1 Tax=Pseudalkalibacillus sp. A8 TaxID=3382641 RepID=UPI001CD525C3